MADTELLPCPFCGGDAQTDFIEGESYLIECYACRAETGIKDSEEEAIAAWSRRATPPSPSTAPDELLDMLGRVHPYAMPMEDFERAEQRLQRAVDLQQPLPVPDQAAIVWRGDLMRLIDELQHKRSVFDDWKKMRAALASRPAEVGDQIPRESNDALIALARYWKLNGDWMTCKGCRRSLIASRDGEELAHGDGCKYWGQQHPWAQLRKLITRRPAPAGAAQ